MQFQIRDARYGLALYTADTAEQALADFVADRAKGTVLAHATTREDGVAVVSFNGETFFACPPGTENAVPNSGASG